MYEKNAAKKALIAILVGAAFAISACGSPTEQSAANSTSDTTTEQPAAPARPSDTVAPPSSAQAAPQPEPSPTTAAAKPNFPPAVAKLEHGGKYWGVYVTVVRTDDNLQIKPDDQKRLDAAAKSLTDLGYKPDSGAFDAGCEQGFREQLQLDPQRRYAAARIFFATQAHAQQFVKAYQPGIVGTANVTLYCMD